MRPLTLFTVLLTLISFSSCAPTWQYIKLDSREVTKDASKRFSWENDTLSLLYNYNGYGGPVWLCITNKTDKPMYINWKKSAIINWGYARSLFQPNVQMTGSFVSETQRAYPATPRGYTTSSGSLVGSFSMPEGMDFIPPHSNISKTLDLVVFRNPLKQDEFKGSPELLKVKRRGDAPAGYKLYTFDSSSSPVQFKSYLTFVLDSDNAKEFSVSHAFYAREIMLAQRMPEYFAPYKDEGDMLYILQSKQ